MPIYEFKCPECGERTEVIQKISDAPASQCPKCGAEMKKLFSAPSFQLKGSGWYKTDYAAKSETKADTKSETKADSKTESKSEAKTESKTETKSETKAESKTETK